MEEMWCGLLDMGTDIATGGGGIHHQTASDLHDPSFWPAFADCAASFIAGGGDNACFGDLVGPGEKVEGVVTMDDDAIGFLGAEADHLMQLQQQEPMLSSTSSLSSRRSLSIDSGASMSSFSLDAAAAPLHVVTGQYQAAPVAHGLLAGDGGEHDEAIMRAMMAVFSSSSASPSSSASASSPQPFLHDSNAQQPAAGPGAMAAAAAQQPHVLVKSRSLPVPLVKAAGRAEQTAAACGNSSQLYHMMSERKRREKLNDSFHTLRSLLPPCSKKDKTTVLIHAAKYLKTLETEITELEEKNGKLEKHIDGGGSDVMRAAGRAQQRAKVQISKQAAEQEQQQQQLVINLTVMVMVECDVVELVLHILECLKWMKEISVLSVDADTYSPQVLLKAIASIKLQIMDGDWNEASFHEAMTKAANEATLSCAPPLALTAA